jgi:regulator of protease activity HflC (stomatin/prohibitin superfamily)
LIPYRLIAALALAVALTGGAYLKGRADNEARHIAAALVQARADADATRKLAAAEQEARLLAQALEDRAYADPVAVPMCLSADRVRRLNLR